MNIIETTFERLPRERLVIGFEGENQRATVRIDCASVFAEYPNATPALIVKPLFADAYPVVVDRNGTDVDWLITSEILSFSGDGEIQLVFYKDEVICKSAITKIRVCRSLTVTGEMPDPVVQWIENANRKLAEVDAQIVELEGMVDTATDAATRAEQSASTASTKAEQAAGSAATATAKATEATNAAGTATAKAAEAALSATQASNSAVSAADSERIATAKAAEAAQSAQTAAQKAEQITEAAQIATGKAGEASASATAAQASASNAASSATAAQASQTAASTSATQAAQSAQTANTAAQTATQKATEATQSATNAATSATNAATSAETASTKAGEAAQSAQAAEETAEQLAESLEQISQNTADIAEHEQAYNALKAATLIHNTASGAIASFPDGAEMPVDEVTAQINPVQDLHGYSNPWPAGGGENLLDPNLKFPTGTQYGLTLTSADGYTFSFTGTATSSGNIQSSIVNQADAVILPAGTYISKNGTLSLYKTDGRWLKNQYSGYVFTVDEPFWVRNIYWQITEGQTYNASNFIALVKGSTAPTEWTPYANICPITGFEGLTVTRCGKNWFTFPTYEQYRNAPSSSNGYKNIPIRVKPQTYYYLFTTYASGFTPPNGFWFVAHDKNNNAWKSIIHQSNGIVNGTVKSDDDGYLWLNIYSYYYSEETFNNIVASIDTQLIEGTTAPADFTPYEGETYSITFPSEAGTVYGGSLNIAEDGSGTLTVDRVFKAITRAEGKSEDSSGYFWYTTSGALGVPVIIGLNANLLSDRMKPVANVTKSGKDGEIAFYANGILRWKEQGALTVAEYNEYLASNPLQICYEPATTQTYTLTAAQITTLLGENNLWHDANGDISVGYKANTKLYIDGKIAELVAQIVNS